MSTEQLRTTHLAAAAQREELETSLPLTGTAETRGPAHHPEPVQHSETASPTVVTRSKGRPLKHRDYVTPISEALLHKSLLKAMAWCRLTG